LREGARKVANTQRFGDQFSKYLAKTLGENHTVSSFLRPDRETFDLIDLGPL
jgi:hypothetical protein